MFKNKLCYGKPISSYSRLYHVSIYIKLHVCTDVPFQWVRSYVTTCTSPPVNLVGSFVCHNVYVPPCEFSVFVRLGCWDLGMLGSWDFGTLGLWDFRILGFGDLGNFGISGFWDPKIFPTQKIFLTQKNFPTQKIFLTQKIFPTLKFSRPKRGGIGGEAPSMVSVASQPSARDRIQGPQGPEILVYYITFKNT